MEQYILLVITGFISFIVGLSLKYIEPKSRLVWWASHGFLFNIPPQKLPNQESMTAEFPLYTLSITIQNMGRKTADSIEVVHSEKPPYFQLQPRLDYEVSSTPSNEHILKISHLPPRDYVSIEFLGTNYLPELLYIRSKTGKAKQIEIQEIQKFPKWVNRLIAFLIITGIVSIITILSKGAFELYQYFKVN